MCNPLRLTPQAESPDSNRFGRSREKAGTSVAGNNAAAPVDAGDVSDDDFKPKGKAKPAFSAFAALGLEEPPADEEEEEDFGGLMVRISAPIYLSLSCRYLAIR